LNTKLLGFEHIKKLYVDDDNFGQVYGQYEHSFDNYFMHNEFLFKDKRLCVPKCLLCEFLMREAHESNLMEHFGVVKTLVCHMSIFTGLT
jgi:hypothetical protein